ncbi:uncharacterized protein CTRU02_213057 [Colletotrichum truncatum]|uniref:Uncharacterized protein n=1 Tax=Colletotrichum truncatum TaxID=5467 RepID=A0ACC3YJN9_COLTU|nr:uncharacterized protein CTRU02_03379 [Colletotrichum truncatum]KAF6797348.1 hypothetical protein CTRU02_03379 [Colletotrichum truncatum]
MASSTPDRPFLDHIVFLLPPQILASLPTWLSSEFTILNGGRHADGRTENKLVIFADGAYLELISFVEGIGQEDRLKHPWGSKPDGTLVDWALSLAEESSFSAIQERVRASQSVVSYNDPVPGGRIRPDGEELKWAVAQIKPEGKVERGELPFWCLDRTPRSLRVPNHVPDNIKHPSGALGIHSVEVDVSSEELKKAYAGIINRPGEGENGGQWTVDVLVRQFEDPRYIKVQTVAGEKSKQSIRLALYTAVGTSRRSISGDLGGGISITIDLIPVSGESA